MNFIPATAYHFCLNCLQHSRNLEHRLKRISVVSLSKPNAYLPSIFRPSVLRFILNPFHSRHTELSRFDDSIPHAMHQSYPDNDGSQRVLPAPGAAPAPGVHGHAAAAAVALVPGGRFNRHLGFRGLGTSWGTALGH